MIDSDFAPQNFDSNPKVVANQFAGNVRTALGIPQTGREELPQDLPEAMKDLHTQLRVPAAEEGRPGRWSLEKDKSKVALMRRLGTKGTELSLLRVEDREKGMHWTVQHENEHTVISQRPLELTLTNNTPEYRVHITDREALVALSGLLRDVGQSFSIESGS